MNCGNDCERKKDLKNCLIQLDLLFQWLAAVENKPIEKDGAEMGSNFAKFKIYPEYNEFIKYACQAEEHFSTCSYNSCGNSCRFSLEAFTEYIYKEKNLEIDSRFFVLDKTGARVLDAKNPTGYKLTTGWLDAKISSSSFQEYFREKNAFPTKTEKILAAQFSHYDKKTVYDANGALSILSMLYNLYAHCVGKERFAGTPRFDVSLLENCPKELIKPQLTIEVNGKEERIPQNNLIKAILSKKVSEPLIKENLSFINKTDVLGNTPLSLAVYNDDFDTVKLLLENGADPNFYFKNLDFFLHTGDFYKSVCEETKNDHDKFKLVMREYIEAHRCIPLIVAIKKDNKPIVDLLLQYGAKTWDSCIDDWYGVARIPTECSTVLACAYFYNAEECIRFLLNKNDIDINRKTVTGVTPLMLAVENGRNYNKLLKKGARIDSKDDCRNSVFLHAVQNMRGDYELLESLLETANDNLNTEELKELLDHAGHAGCPISYMNEKEANLYLEYGADVNAKNEDGVSCIVDVAYLNPDMLPWFKEHDAKLDFKALFFASNFLDIKYEPKRRPPDPERFFNKFNKILSTAAKYDLITSKDLDFSVPIDNIPRISPLIDAILFTQAKGIQRNTDDGNKKNENEFLSDAQLSELYGKYPLIKELSKIERNISSYSHVKDKYKWLVKWVNEGLPATDSQKNLTEKEILKLPKRKLDFNVDMALEEVYKAIASVKELSKAQRVALFERYPFTKELEMRGIDLNVPEEIESNYNTDWEMSTSEIIAAIREIKTEVPYEDVKISPLDDALIAKNYEAAAIYLTKGIYVSELTKILLLSVHDVPERDSSEWKDVLVALRLRKDIDFSDVLITLCKTHPKDDFDIAEEFINNGYNFYRFANYIFWYEAWASGISNCDYNIYMHQNEDGTDNESPSIEEVRERNNKKFLKQFGETSFQDVNLRLIKNTIAFGANLNIQDEVHKAALDYAKENEIDETVFTISSTIGVTAINTGDIYEFTVDMKPSKTGAILGHIIDSDGKTVKGSISKSNIPSGKSALDFSNTKIKVIKTSELQTKQAGEPYYQLNFAP